MKYRRKYGQTAIEYLLLLAATIVVIFVAITVLMPHVYIRSERIYNITANLIVGNPVVDRSNPGGYP